MSTVATGGCGASSLVATADAEGWGAAADGAGVAVARDGAGAAGAASGVDAGNEKVTPPLSGDAGSGAGGMVVLATGRSGPGGSSIK
jgi:hypothetical protein